MLRTFAFRSLFWLGLVASPGLLACSSSDRSPSGASSIDSVAREGDASQAQLDTFRQREPRHWDWAGGQFDTPDDHATVSPHAPLTFSWHADPADFAPDDAPGEVVMAHLLAFSTARNARLLEVFTTLPQYTPSAEAWQKLADAGKPITLSLTTGSFVGPDLPADGGPFIGQTITFVIE
jgi:hypothetical protein